MVDFKARDDLFRLREERKALDVVIAEKEREALEEELPEQGTPITAAEAAAKYGIGINSPMRWYRAGLVKVICEGTMGRGNGTTFDERDIAWMARQDMRSGRRTDLLRKQCEN